MKILLDACVSGGASGTLRAAGHDVVWAGDWDESPSDQDIIARAAADGRILVTRAWAATGDPLAEDPLRLYDPPAGCSLARRCVFAMPAWDAPASSAAKRRRVAVG